MLNNLLTSEVRLNILKLLLLNSQRGYHVRGIVRAVKAEINAVRRELDNLFEIGLVKKRQSSNRIYYRADTDHPFFNDLLSLVSKEEGIGKKIIENEDQLGRISYAMLSLAFLRGRKSTALDVDLFIVGQVNLDFLKKLVLEEESKLGKEINYSVMSKEEFVSRKRTNDQFINRVLTQSRTMLIGDEEQFYSILYTSENL